MGFTDETVRFNLDDGNKQAISETLTTVYRSLEEKGYNPINQIVGYVLSGDPAYILATTMHAIKYVSTSVTKSLRNWLNFISKEMGLIYENNGIRRWV